MPQKNYKTRHHLIPKERKRKKNISENQSKLYIDATITLWRDKHDSWHHLFKNMTLDEIIDCLQRVKRLCIRKLQRYNKSRPNGMFFQKKKNPTGMKNPITH